MNRLALKATSRTWLRNGHRYVVNTTATLESDVTAGTVNDADIGEYIAASAALHCSDGWADVGRALEASVNGNSGIAVHLGYYAALRAAMSFLASQGIGVLNKKHVVITRKGVRVTNGMTHEFAWDALGLWLTLPDSPKEFGSLIVADAYDLAIWLDAFEPGFLMSRIWTQWMQQVGLDSVRFIDDRTNRNDASYRPDGINPRRAAAVRDTAQLLSGVWQLGEPTDGPFNELNRHFLRLAIESAGVVLGLVGAAFEDAVNAMVAKVIPDLGARARYVDFLMRRRSPADHLVLRIARRPSGGRDQEGLEVIARAVLLLVFATAEADYMLGNAHYRRDELRFWWKELGADRGLWSAGRFPSSSDALWPDVSKALDRLQRWIDGNKAVKPSRHVWHRELRDPLAVLAGCERIALWGLRL